MSEQPTDGYIVSRIRLLHNEERDERDGWPSVWRGYEASTAELREVWTTHMATPIAADDDLERALHRIASHVYEVTNADVDMLAGEDASLAADYRRGRVRSTSLGDVIVIEAGNQTHAFAVDRVGFRSIAIPTGFAAGAPAGEPA